MKPSTLPGYFSIGCLCVLAFNFGIIKSENIYQKWQSYRDKFHKKYKNDDEDRARFNIFAENSKLIDEINAKMVAEKKSYRAGYTQLTDLLLEEYQSAMGVEPYSPPLADSVTEEPPNNHSNLPESFDYRYVVTLSSVKNQFDPKDSRIYCRAGYAFASVASIESHWILANNLTISLSTQQIIDCVEPHIGCFRKDYEKVFKYAKEHGIEGDTTYPYIGDAGFQNCKANAVYAVVKLDNYIKLQEHENGWIKYLVERGPFTVKIDPGSKYFQHYAGGILEDPDCAITDNGTHCVSIVGYGEQQGQKYWIAKNSFGLQWGLEGYILLKRGVNQCGLGLGAILPLIEESPIL